ncbi:hypothetical protein Syun_025272 [Stephania yunnanensis]|uniref:Disease resistance protein n=1 Tax=Stephania yunnanensis TaxID=152371 RepID=A0AAP0EUB2_9MAGN
MISHCDKLELLPNGLYDLSSLINLYLDYCPFLTAFPEGGLPTTLRLLWIEECYNLRLLPEKMHILTSLQELKVKNFPLLVKFPEEGLPNSLKLLEITGCEILQLSPAKVLHKLALLGDLVINGCPGVMSSLKEECLLPANLE